MDDRYGECSVGVQSQPIHRMFQTNSSFCEKTLPRSQTSAAVRRLLTEKAGLEECPVGGCVASPREDDLFYWSAVIEGPENTVYEGGLKGWEEGGEILLHACIC